MIKMKEFNIDYNDKTDAEGHPEAREGFICGGACTNGGICGAVCGHGVGFGCGTYCDK